MRIDKIHRRHPQGLSQVNKLLRKKEIRVPRLCLQYLIKKGGSGGTTLPHGVQKLDKTRVLGLLKASHYAALHHRHKLLVAQLSII